MIASALVHAGIALLFFRATAISEPGIDPFEIDLVEIPPLPPPPPPRDLDIGAAATARASTPNVAAISHLTSAAIVTDKEDAFPIAPDASNIPSDAEPGDESANGAHLCESNDCVLEALNRCLAGDPDGCVGVGLYYEERRGDSFSAIKWYVKGCDLSSSAACAANDRVKNAMPLGWAHHASLKPASSADTRSL